MLMLRLICTASLVLLLTFAAHGAEEFLDPQEAFRFSASLLADGELEIRYRIADGYCMYRDRYRFRVETGTGDPQSIELGPAKFPPGEWHEDEYFGRSEIFRDEVLIRIPVMVRGRNATAFTLVAVSQGCADGGICYLPTTETIDFQLIGSNGLPRTRP